MKLEQTLQNFGGVFARAETLYIVILSLIIIGIGIWAVATSETYNQKGLEKEHYGFMFIGGGIMCIIFAILFTYAVSKSPKLAGLVGFSAILQAIGK
jgi:hypothetical protein